MESADPLDRELMRARILLLGMMTAFLFLGAALWRVQVRNASRYRSSLDRQSMRRVRLPGTRGLIRDRNGVVLAENRPSYCIAIYVEELRQRGRSSNTVNKVEAVVDRLAAMLGLPREITRDSISRHIARRAPMPLLAWKDVDEVALARWAENDGAFPGVDVYVEPVRSYAQGALASHVLGHVGRSDPDPDEPYHFYLPDMEGRAGVERTLNVRLAGVAGGRLIRVDAMGFKHDEAAEREPIAGQDVTLALDARLQEILEGTLRGVKGAGVMLDPRNGDVLAMASSPAFDPKDLRSIAEFERLSTDPGKPLFNRAACGLYPPGSIFKPLVALAAMENRSASANTAFECIGHFDLGGFVFGCWRHSGHGVLTMRKAMEQSCDAYFYQLGLQCGHDPIVRMAKALGLGQPTGVELAGEADGLVPDNAWKRRKYRDAWRSGDTCNLSIGQGALLVTPLQMAVMCAALANGGYVHRPRLVRRGHPEESERVARMPWPPEALAVVRGGMRDVIEAEEGTGRRARIEGVAMGGKTGSAEHGPKGNRRIYGWMLAFAPYDTPRYAVAMVIEDAESGGITVAPRIRELMQRTFETERAGTQVAALAGGAP